MVKVGGLLRILLTEANLMRIGPREALLRTSRIRLFYLFPIKFFWTIYWAKKRLAYIPYSRIILHTLSLQILMKRNGKLIAKNLSTNAQRLEYETTQKFLDQGMAVMCGYFSTVTTRAGNHVPSCLNSYVRFLVILNLQKK